MAVQVGVLDRSVTKTLLLVCFGIFILVVLYALHGAILATLKIIFRLIVALLVSLLVGMAVYLAFGDETSGLLIGLACLLISGPSALKWQRRTVSLAARCREGSVVGRDSRLDVGAPKLKRGPSSAWPRKDRNVAMNWEKIASTCPAYQTELNIARDHCSRLLRYSRSGRNSARFEIEEHAMLIRKHIPALAAELDDCTALSDDAAATSWRDECAANLIAIGARCAELMAEERDRSNDTLAVRTSHLRGRLGSSQGSKELD